MLVDAADRPPLLGAWEAVLDRASLKVWTYLASSNTPFDCSTPLAKSMLCLLDHQTLRDVLVERNVSGLCGSFGCPCMPRGVTRLRQHRAEARGTALEEDDGAAEHGQEKPLARTRALTDGEIAYMAWQPPHRSGSRRVIISDEPDKCSCSDLDDEAVFSGEDDAGAGDDTCEEGNAMVLEDPSTRTDHADPEELVYDDDYFTLESFRLARRQEQQLARLRRRAQRAREQQGARERQDSVSSGRRHRGAESWERFCSLECEDRYLHEIRPAVRHFRTYDHAAMRQAVAHLFPMLRPDILMRLADADVASGAADAPLVAATVKEASDVDAVNDPQKFTAVQTGVDYEATASATTNDTSADDNGAVAAVGSVGDALRAMQVLGKVWDAEVTTHNPNVQPTTAPPPPTQAASSGAVQPPPVAVARGGLDETSSTDDDEGTGEGHTGRAAVVPTRSSLSGAWLVLDFLTAAAGETTHYLFFYYYCLRRPFLHAKLAQQVPTSTLGAVIGPVLTALEKRAQALFCSGGDGATTTDQTAEDRARAAWRRLLEVRDVEALRVNPLTQQPRRELFAGRYLSGETAAAVARLLLADERALFDGAWHGVWMRPVSADIIIAAGGPAVPSANPLADAHAVLTLTHSLRFQFAVPAALLQPIAASREALILALAMVLAALCVSDSTRLWRTLAESDADGALGEVMEAVGLTTEEMGAIVVALVLGQEDNTPPPKAAAS